MSSPVEVTGYRYVVGLDVGSQQVVYALYQPEKRPVGKPTELSNDREGFVALDERLRQLGVAPEQILIGLEATGRYSENLYQYLARAGLSALSAASAPDAPVCRATWPARQDRPTGCHHGGAAAAQWGGARRLRAR